MTAHTKHEVRGLAIHPHSSPGSVGFMETGGQRLVFNGGAIQCAGPTAGQIGMIISGGSENRIGRVAIRDCAVGYFSDGDVGTYMFDSRLTGNDVAMHVRHGQVAQYFRMKCEANRICLLEEADFHTDHNGMEVWCGGVEGCMAAVSIVSDVPNPASGAMVTKTAEFNQWKLREGYTEETAFLVMGCDGALRPLSAATSPQIGTAWGSNTINGVPVPHVNTSNMNRGC